MTSVAELRDVQFSWGGRSAFGLRVPHLSLGRGERVLLLGPSGAGKSTLLSLIAGIIRPQKGAIDLDGTDIVSLSASARDRFRAEKIGLIFQSLNLLPYLSAVENILLPLHFAPQRRRRVALSGGEVSTANALLDGLGLPSATYAALPARALSIGQQQRVAAARALIGTPDLIIADEPTSALDADRRAAFLDVLKRQLDGTDTALLLVSHDSTLAPFFDRVLQLADIARVEERP